MLSYSVYPRIKIRSGAARRVYGSVIVWLGDKVAASRHGYNGMPVVFNQLEKSMSLLYGILLPYQTNGLCLDLSIGPFWKWNDLQNEARSGRGVTVFN